jgi:CDP-diacylglycerol--glycerol-3-phosphate 3-phosphatidyltransferase
VSGRTRGRPEPFGLGWPNVVSLGRIVLVPLVVWLVVREAPGGSWVACAAFGAAALSDGLDGYLARRHRMATTTGAWLDPLSDKLLVGVPALVLSIVGRFPWWATAVIVGREVVVTALRWRLDRRGVSMPASSVAKAKTVVQLLALGLAIAPLSAPFDPVTLGVIVAAVVLTVYSGAEYLLTSRHRVRAP